MRKFAPFGLAALLFLCWSTRIGHDNLSGAAQAKESAREAALPAPRLFGSSRAPAFPGITASSTADRRFVRLASLTFDDDLVGSIGRSEQQANGGESRVNRAAKGDLLVPRLQIELSTRREEPETQSDIELEAALRYQPFPEHDISLSLELTPQVPPESSDDAATADASSDQLRVDSVATFGRNRVLFDASPIGEEFASIEPFPADEAPVVLVPASPKQTHAAVAPRAMPGESAVSSGVTVAGKGEVTGEGRRPKTPAEILELTGKGRAKAEKCLANAVYFEARGEAVRGQIGVAQVVLNRAFSGYYPEDVCGVVYQNAHRHLACQFTFACDGIRDAVNDADAWDRAKRIARAALDGKVWLNEVGKATHYHANWVRPNWVRTMRKLTRIGVHSFYRPRKWGDGSDEPIWRDLAMTELASKL